MDKIFLIKSDLCVYEIKDLISIGSGRVVASGAFHTLNDLEIKERLIKSVEVASKIKNGVDLPFLYINNKDLNFEVIPGGL